MSGLRADSGASEHDVRKKVHINGISVMVKRLCITPPFSRRLNDFFVFALSAISKIRNSADISSTVFIFPNRYVFKAFSAGRKWCIC